MQPTTQPRQGSRFRWLAAAFALAILAAAGAWWYLRGPAVTAVKATRGAVAEIVYATGSVEPETWSRSTPLVRGRIVERCRCEGTRVKAGDILARLDDQEALATLNDLRALEEFQRQEFERQTQLLERGVATSQAHQKAESDLAQDPGADRGTSPASGLLQAGCADGRDRPEGGWRSRRHGRPGRDPVPDRSG